MEAAMSAPELKSQELSIGREKTKMPTEIALQETKQEVRGAEDRAGAKFKVPECAGTSEMKATEDTQSEITVRAAETVAKAQMSMILRTAKAEVGDVHICSNISRVLLIYMIHYTSKTDPSH